MHLFRTQVRLGIDIGHATIKAAVRDTRGRMLELLQTPVMSSRQQLDQKPSPAEVAGRLEGLVGKYIERGRYNVSVVASAQGDGAVGAYLKLPALAPEQRDLAVESAVVKQLPFGPSEALLNYLSVPSLNGDQGWFFFALRKTAADSVRAVLESAGMREPDMRIHALALLRSYAENHGGKGGDEFHAMLHVGARLTCVLVLRGSHPYAVRCFKIGADDFTYAFQMGLQTSWDEAEAHKRSTDATAREVPVEPALARWLEQVARSVRAFGDGNLERRVSRVLLSGGGAAWKGLDRRVSEALEVPVEVDGWDALVGTGGAVYGDFAIAIGLVTGERL